MDVIRADGTEYTKVAVLAKEFGYTKDYLGQLCRSGKVDAKLVGRAWYVSRESVVRHQSVKRLARQVQQSNPQPSPVKVAVEAVLPRSTARQLRYLKQPGTLRVSVGNYDSDQAPNFPLVSREANLDPTFKRESVALQVNLVSPRQVRVHKSSNVTLFKTPPLHEVRLRGTVAVHALLSEDEREKTSEQDVAQVHQPVEHTASGSSDVVIAEPSQPMQSIPRSQNSSHRLHRHPKSIPQRAASSQVVTADSPAYVTSESVTVPPAATPRMVARFAVPALLVATLFIAFGVVFLESVSFVSESVVQSNFTFNLAALYAVVGY